MPKSIPNHLWKYIIISLDDGDIRGTDDIVIAQEFAMVEENYVIETTTCTVVGPVQVTLGEDQVFENTNIREQTLYEFGHSKGSKESDR